jgi:hypothetical protein
MIREALKNLLGSLDDRQIRILSAASILIFFVAMSTTLYVALRRVDTSERRIKKINQLRDQAKKILTRHAIVKKQQAEVNTVLDRDRSFKIKEFFTTIISELSLGNSLTKQPEVTDPQDLGNGYSEIKLDASFTGLSTQQLVDLLYKIEQSERIYTKEVIVTKAQKSPTLDLAIVLATLQQKIAPSN